MEYPKTVGKCFLSNIQVVEKPKGGGENSTEELPEIFMAKGYQC